MCRSRQDACSPDAASRSAPNSRTCRASGTVALEDARRTCRPGRRGPSTTSGRSSATSAHTSSAASRLNVPANTEGAAHSRRSPGEHSSWDHSMAVRSVWCLGSAPGGLAAGQHREPAVKPVDELGKRHRAQPDGRELDRQRNAVEPPAQPDDIGHVVRGNREAGHGGGGAQREQLDRVPAPARPPSATGSQSSQAPAAARPGTPARPACRAAAAWWRARSRRARPESRPGLSAAQASSRCSQVSRMSSRRRSFRYWSTD